MWSWSVRRYHPITRLEKLRKSSYRTAGRPAKNWRGASRTQMQSVAAIPSCSITSGYILHKLSDSALQLLSINSQQLGLQTVSCKHTRTMWTKAVRFVVTVPDNIRKKSSHMCMLRVILLSFPLAMLAFITNAKYFCSISRHVCSFIVLFCRISPSFISSWVGSARSSIILLTVLLLIRTQYAQHNGLLITRKDERDF